VLLLLRRFIHFRGAEGAALNEIMREGIVSSVIKCNECVVRLVQPACSCHNSLLPRGCVVVPPPITSEL